MFVGHGVTVASWIGAGNPVAARRIDQHRRRAARDAERPDVARIVPAVQQLLENGAGIADSTFSLLKPGVCGQNEP